MNLAVRSILFGSDVSARQRDVSLSVAVGLFGTTFAAYALGVFEIAGGLVVVPGHAALVGVLGAGWVGSRRSGLATAWLVAYAALLGYSADHYFLGLSGRTFPERAAAFLGPDGLAFLGIEALVLGTLGCFGGTVCRRGLAFVRETRTRSDTGE